MSLRNYLDKVRRYFWFSKKELGGFVLVVLTLGFITSFTKWGGVQFDARVGVWNWFVAALIFVVVVFVHHAGQRLMGLAVGLRVEHEVWWQGVIAGVILALVSNGRVKFLAATRAFEHFMPVHRLGAFRYGPNVKVIAKITMAGPLANVVCASVVKYIESAGWISSVIGDQLFFANVWFAFWNLLPIPPIDGSKIMYASRFQYFSLLFGVLLFAVVAYVVRVYALLVAVIFGPIAALVFARLAFGENWKEYL